MPQAGQITYFDVRTEMSEAQLLLPVNETNLAEELDKWLSRAAKAFEKDGDAWYIDPVDAVELRDEANRLISRLRAILAKT